MKNRRWIVGVGLVLLLIGVWKTRDDSPLTVAGPEPAEAPARDVAHTRPATQPTRPEAEEPREAVHPIPAQKEALLITASATGLGMVRCDLGAAPEGSLATPFTRTVWEGGVAIGVVDQPEGAGTLSPAKPPAELLEEDPDAWIAQLKTSKTPSHLLTWGEAFPGEEGWCEVTAPHRVTISGRVETEDGEPATGAWVNGCSGGSQHLDTEGRFSFKTWSGAPCTLSVRSSGIPGTGIEVSRTEDVSGIVLIDHPVDFAEAMAERADALAWEDVMVHPLEIALEDPDLTDDVRAVLSDWLEEERDEAARLQAFYAQGAELFEKNASEE